MARPRLDLGAAILLLTCCLGVPSGPSPDGKYNVLFVGNSLTYQNELPLLVEALAQAGGADSVAVGMVAEPNYSLEDHWNDGTARRTIERSGWDVVVLQQGPSALPESRVLLLDYAGRFDGLIRQGGGRPALYMVWPSRARFGDFDRVSESYSLTAQAVQGLLFPCGEAWRAAWRRDPALALYDADDFHPSMLGTYACALVMVHRLTGRTPIGLPASVRLRTGVRYSVDPATAALLQQAALEADSQF